MMIRLVIPKAKKKKIAVRDCELEPSSKPGTSLENVKRKFRVPLQTILTT